MENEQKLLFENYYNLLDKKRKAEIRNEFLKTSGISYPAFYSKLRKGNFFNLEVKELSRICGVEFTLPNP